MKFEDKVSKLRIKKHQGKETKEFLEDVVTLAQGEALEYILGEVDFCGTKVDLSLRPMIPRPETEHWVKQVIDNRQPLDPAQGKQTTDTKIATKKLRVLDLFSGSGCVGLSVLKNIPDAHVTFGEVDEKSREQIDISLRKNTIDTTRAEVVIEDCVPFLKRASALQKWDAVFAVPPYVPRAMQDEVMEELHAEDPLFFFDRDDGYYYHKQVLAHAKELLVDGGTLYLEFDIIQRETIEQLAKDYDYKNFSFLQDPYGHECVITLNE